MKETIDIGAVRRYRNVMAAILEEIMDDEAAIYILGEDFIRSFEQYSLWERIREQLRRQQAPSRLLRALFGTTVSAPESPQLNFWRNTVW